MNADSLLDTGSGSPLSTNTFAYCENNAISRIDEFGEWYYTLSDYEKYLKKQKKTYNQLKAKAKKGRHNKEQFEGFKAFYTILSQNYSGIKKRYNYNLYVYNAYLKAHGSRSNLIFGQNSPLVADLLFGPRNLAVSGFGCGAVALHNMICIAGRPPSFPGVILELELNNGLWFEGSWGTLASAIAGYLKAHSIKFDTYTSTKQYVKNASKYSISILYVRNKGKLSRHYYCIQKIKGKYYAINYSNYDTAYRKINLKDVKRVIKAYCVR